jgi:hypothetical protein
LGASGFSGSRTAEIIPRAVGESASRAR